MTDDRSAQDFLTTGKAAFEAGHYRSAIELLQQGEVVNAADADRSMPLDGELKTWLVMAYEASGDRTAALELCRVISRHPHADTRHQGKQLLYILEAPKLKLKSEWLTEIPDLTQLEPSEERTWTSPIANLAPPPKPRPIKQEGYVIPEPTDPTTVNMGDERSILWALGAAIVILLGVLGFA